MAGGDVRTLTVRWLGDSTSLVKSTSTAEKAVTSSGKKMEDAGAGVGGAFGKLGKLLGAFNLPFAGAAKSAEGDLSKLESAGVTSGAGLGGALSAGFAVAGAAAIAFAASSVKAAQDFDHADETLQTVVTNTGESMSKVGGAITGADNRLVSLGFTTTETEQALAKLVPVTHNVDDATKLLSTAADVARARNMSLTDATQLLVGIEAGRMRGLTQLGLATKDVTGKTITAKAAVAEITQLYGGAASQYAASYEGKLAVLHATINQLQVSIGNTLIPALSSLAGVAAIPVAGLNLLDEGLHHAGTSLGGVVAGIASLGVSVLINKGRTEEHKKATDDLASSMDNLKKSQQAYAEDLAAGDTTSAKAIADRKAYTDAQTKAQTITTGLTTATVAQTAAETAQTKATAANEAALKKQTDAILGSADADIALSNATLGVSDQLDTYNGKAKDAAAWGGKNAQANRDWEKASNDVKGAIDNVATSAGAAATQQAALHGKTLSARDAAAAEEGALEKLRDTIKPGNPFRAYLDQLIGTLDNVARRGTARSR